MTPLSNLRLRSLKTVCLVGLSIASLLPFHPSQADPPNTGDQALNAALTAILTTRDVYIARHTDPNATPAEKAVYDAEGWVTPEATCDSTLFSGLLNAGASRWGYPGNLANMYAAYSYTEYGRIYRTATHDCTVYNNQLKGWQDNGSKNSASADMYFGVLYYWYAAGTGISFLADMIAYLDAHPSVPPAWKETGVPAKFKRNGAAFGFLENPAPKMAPPLQGTICELHRHFSVMPDMTECRLRFSDAAFLNAAGNNDYTANLEVLHVLLRVLITGGVTPQELKVLKVHADRPMQAFFKTAYAFALTARVHERIVTQNGMQKTISYAVLKNDENPPKNMDEAFVRAANKKDICKYGKQAAEILTNVFTSQTDPLPGANPAQTFAQAFAGRTLFPPAALPGELHRDTYYLWQRLTHAGGQLRGDWKPKANSTKLFSGTDFLIASWILLQVPFDCANINAAPNPPPAPTAAPIPLDDPNYFYTNPEYQECLTSFVYENEVREDGTSKCPVACIDGSTCEMVPNPIDCTGEVIPDTICVDSTPTPVPSATPTMWSTVAATPSPLFTATPPLVFTPWATIVPTFSPTPTYPTVPWPTATWVYPTATPFITGTPEVWATSTPLPPPTPSVTFEPSPTPVMTTVAMTATPVFVE